jgi:hypothetical protein
VKWRRDPEDPRGTVPESFKFTLEEFEKIHGLNYLRQREKVVLAKPESIAQLAEIMALFDKDVAASMQKEWFKAAGVDSLEFFREDQIIKCIDYVQKKLKGVK